MKKNRINRKRLEDLPPYELMLKKKIKDLHYIKDMGALSPKLINNKKK